MIRDHFRILSIDLSTGRGNFAALEGRNQAVGGSGLAALLFRKYGQSNLSWDHPSQPLILAIGPLTGYFPLMSKTVCAFRSPYHDQYAESHGGGRSALALRFADLDALVITGKAPRPSCLIVGSRNLELKDAHYLWGLDVQVTGKMLRHMVKGSGHRSILRIGPAGERGLPMACINVDTYRHFGRLGGGGVMGAKNLKAIVIQGDGIFPIPGNKEYPLLFREIYQQVTATPMMRKYHDLGTPENVSILNGLQALPCRNLKQTSDPNIEGISGERFARDLLLRNMACSGCPLGCIHVGFLREKFMEENQYFYRQVSYDHEPIFAVGSMLGVTDGFAVLALIDTLEKEGLDVMSSGVALAWATEALEKGILSERETKVALRFGDAQAYREAIHHLAVGTNEFYRLLGQGTMKAAGHYGGGDWACVLGQEMAGYATGEVFFVSQALGFRHSHLDAAGYGYDQAHRDRDLNGALDSLFAEERERVFLTSMVACLFARNVYRPERLAQCLRVVGYPHIAEGMASIAASIQKNRWQVRLATGYDPRRVTIPRRFFEVRNWKGPIDGDFLQALKDAYAARIREWVPQAEGVSSA
jgi:aldehyde:ferredoxin oxidoreductase